MVYGYTGFHILTHVNIYRAARTLNFVIEEDNTSMTDSQKKPSRKKTPVARVNGAEITDFQVEAGMDAVLEPYKDTKGKIRVTQEERYSARKHVIDKLIMRELLYQEGCKKSIKAEDGEIEEIMQSAVKGYGSEREFKAMLVMAGLSPSEYRESVEKDIIINKMAASLLEGKRKPVTKEDAKKYYDTHIDEMKGPEVKKIFHAMLPLDRYCDKKDETKAREKLFKMFRSRDDFEKEIKQGSRAQDGLVVEDYGYVLKGQIHPILESVASRLAENEVSRVVRTEEGLHIMVVTGIIKAGEPRPFEIIGKELQEKLYEMQSVNIVQDFVDKLKNKAQIEIFDQMTDDRLDME